MSTASHISLQPQHLVQYDTMAPLEHMAGVAYILSSMHCDEMKESFATKRLITVKLLLRVIKNKIRELQLPSLISEKLLHIAVYMANEMCEWIKYHDEQIFNVGPQMHRIAFRYIDAIKWTSRGNIDYSISAYNLMQLNLCGHVKFRLAYAYRLPDQIAHYTEMLWSEKYMKSTFAKHGRDLLPRSALYYWICYTFDNTIELERLYGYGIRSHCRVEEFLFNVFVRMPNYVLTRHIWTTLTSNERIERTMDLMTTNVPTDLQLYFLSQLTAEEQTLVINCYLPHVFRVLVNDIHARSFNQNLIQYIWNVMSVMDFIEIVKLLFVSIDGTNHIMRRKYKQAFKYFWTAATPHLRRQVLENDHHLELQRDERLRGWHIYSSTALLPFNWIDNEDIVELIMSDATLAQRKCFLKTDASVRYAIHLIKTTDWFSLEQFIHKFLTDPEDLREYKLHILIGDDFALIKHFSKFDPSYAESFYEWCFETDSHKHQFILERRSQMWYKLREFFSTKANINRVQSFLKWCMLPPDHQKDWLEQFKFDVWYNLIGSNDKNDIADIEYFLDWCFDTSGVLCKSRLIVPRHVPTLVRFVCAVIKRHNYRLLDQLLNWCFLYDQRRIQRFKNDFYDNCPFTDFVDLIHTMVVIRHDKFDLFNNFFSTWFYNEHDFRAFKLKITQPRTATWIAADFINRSRMKAADEFFKRCANFSDQQMVDFKSKIFVHESIADVLDHFGKHEYFLQSFVEWINPSKEKYETFKQQFLSDVDLEIR